MKYSIFVFLIFLVLGCSSKKKMLELNYATTKEPLQDLIDFPQNIEFYTKNTKDISLNLEDEFINNYFSMWKIEKPEHTLEEIQWAFNVFKPKNTYGENLLARNQSFYDAMYVQSNFDEYLSLNKKALTINYTHMRALPTNKPVLRNPFLAGEGFPFDYIQNSSINPNVPVFISHYSKDKQWVFIFSSFTHGWVRTRDIVFIDEAYTSLWQKAKQLYIVEEGVTLYTENSEALFNTRIGMLFTLIDEDEKNYTILTVSKSGENQALYHRSVIPKSIASVKPLALNEKNINKIINEVSKTSYGWGGIFEQRDCSSTLMDFYTPFAVALPRNSSKQAEVGQIIDLSTFNNVSKEKLIKEKAIPFETLLYKKGHIVLYVGVYNDDIVVFHNTWGIKTISNQKEGRHLVGKTIFSTLKVGKELENYDESAELLRNIKSMNIITR